MSNYFYVYGERVREEVDCLWISSLVIKIGIYDGLGWLGLLLREVGDGVIWMIVRLGESMLDVRSFVD